MKDPSKFDARRHLDSKRKNEYENCSDLLWENLEAGKWNQLGAFLHKSADGRTAPSPGQTYPATFVTGMPSAV